MAQDLKLADHALIEEDYQTALHYYSQFIEINKTDAAAFCHRAATYLRLKDYMSALEDTNTTIRLHPNYEFAYHQKGVASFMLDEFESAKAAFQKGFELAKNLHHIPECRKYPTWIRKCDVEIDDKNIEQLEQNEKDDQCAQNDQLKSTQIDQLPFTSPSSSSSLPPSQPQLLAAVPCTLRYQFYQTTTDVVVTILEKNLQENQYKIDIGETTFKAEISRNGQISVLEKTLFDRVIPSESSTKCTPTKIEIRLRKANNSNWNDLAGSNKPKEAIPRPLEIQEATISKPYATKRNWDLVDKEIQRQLENEKPEGEEALHKLFREIYSKADEDTRRAMTKSFQTSGGTVLSTNWADVKDKDYEEERVAPDGMEWQTWEGEKPERKK